MRQPETDQHEEKNHMAVRSLARLYYYIVFIAMLVLAAVGIGFVLNTLLSLTPLAGDQPRPDSATITRSILFAGVAWLIAGILGGVHYWLIRRDLETDPTAGPGGIRSFFLNAAQFVAIWVGVASVASALVNIGRPFSFNVIPSLSLGIAALFIAGIVELERMRTTPGSGAPRVFEGLHIYGFLTILIFYAGYYWTNALSETLRRILDPDSICPPSGDFSSSCRFGSVNLGGDWVAVLWVSAAIAAYWLLMRPLALSALRQAFQLIGYGISLIYLLTGLFFLLNLGVRSALGDPFESSELADGYALPAALFGLLFAALYALWLRSERAGSRMGAETTDHSILAILAFEAAVPFWFGVGFIVWRLLEIASGLSVEKLDWAGPIAAVIAGVAYIPISLYLRVLTARTDAIGPRRAFVLALLASGIIAGAIGAATTLFAYGSQLLGAPISNWEDVTRVGVAIFLVGLAVAGIYFWSARSEGLLTPRPSTTPEGAPQPRPQSGQTIEQILDDFAAGRVSRDEAASHIRAAART
jgi:hypothetical protein